jgi:hypothetical protein
VVALASGLSALAGARPTPSMKMKIRLIASSK